MKDDAGTVRLLETEWGAVPVTVLPTSDNSLDLGSAAKSWRTIYIDTSIVLGAAASKIVPGATSFTIRNNADNANNLIITDAGAATVRTSLAVTTTLTVSGNTALAGSENTFGATGVASGIMRPIMVSQSTGSIVRLHTTLSGNGHSTSVEEAGIQFTTDDTDWSAGSIYGSIVMLSENVFGAAYSLLFKNSSQSDGGNDEQMRLTSAGRLGIGITAPLGKLHVYGSAGGCVFVEGTATTTPTTVATGATAFAAAHGSHYDGTTLRTASYSAALNSTTTMDSNPSTKTLQLAVTSGGDVNIQVASGGPASIYYSLMITYR